MSRRGGRLLLPALCIIGACLFTALGIWQVERRAWKLDLIEKVERGIAADPVPLPPWQAWDTLDACAMEYRKVRATGHLLHSRETLVDALTERGPGYWVVTPLRMAEGTVVVNRGFVPPQLRAQASRPESLIPGQVSLVGLMRCSEPGGRVLRPNRPGENRWYSRDVAAIAAAQRLNQVAPFFIDAGPARNPGGFPIGGLTVTKFRNTHLVYALTWFSLAGLCLFGLMITVRSNQERRTPSL